MPVMYCLWDPFVWGTTVYKKDDTSIEPLFTGDFEEVCEFMANKWNEKDYEKIILSGIGVDGMANRIRTYALTNYNNLNINIEVIK